MKILHKKNIENGAEIPVFEKLLNQGKKYESAKN